LIYHFIEFEILLYIKTDDKMDIFVSVILPNHDSDLPLK
jgi:hypothetical protein